MNARSSGLAVRNPILDMPEAIEALRTLDPQQREALRVVLMAIRTLALSKERESYRKRKGPMVSYYMASATWLKHTAHVIRRIQRGLA